MQIPATQVSPHAKKTKTRTGKKRAVREITVTPPRQGDRSDDDPRGVVLRFNDLKARNIVTNWVTLKRWIEREGFPPGFQLAANTRAWLEADVLNWLRSRSAWTPNPPDEAA
jgi:hypothetical protein